MRRMQSRETLQILAQTLSEEGWVLMFWKKALDRSRWRQRSVWWVFPFDDAARSEFDQKIRDSVYRIMWDCYGNTQPTLSRG